MFVPGNTTTQFTSVFEAHSPQTRDIVHLFYFDVGISVFIFVLVACLVVYASIRFRRRNLPGEPPQDPGNFKLETFWTIVPALILTALAVFTAITMFRVNPPVGNRVPDVTIIAHQWWWEFRYPSGAVTANELHMCAESNWLLRVQSADVIHDFWVPDLGAKMDATPGNTNYIWMQPTKTGTYLGTCAEFCGAEHALMGIRVIVDSPKDFVSWEQSQLQAPAEPASDEAKQGARLFDSLTCANCHNAAGHKAGRVVGPDLTHVSDRQTLAAGTLYNSPDNLEQWILNPQHFKPGSHMPNLRITAEEAHQLAVFLDGSKQKEVTRK